MGRHSINPPIANIGLDANALDRNGSGRDDFVERFIALMNDSTLNAVIAGGVRGEIQHPKTPQSVQAQFLPRVFNLRPGLNQGQATARTKVAAVLRGNAKPGRHNADASHLSEADETGCVYFITEDWRILAKRSELYKVLQPSLMIVSLEEFFEIFDALDME